MSEETKAPDLGPDLLNDVTACPEQQQTTRSVERELKKLTNRLERDRVYSVFHLQVYAFNCYNTKNHDRSKTPDPFHVDYVAGGGRKEVPGGVQITIKALEHALSVLKKKVQ